MKRIIVALMLFIISISFVSLNAQWARTYGGNSFNLFRSFQQTSDGGYIVAGTGSFGAGEGDIWILKLSSDGYIEWQRTYGGSESEDASFIQQTSDGGYIVVGTTTSFGAGETDIWFLKLSSDGDIEWQRTYGGSEWDDTYCIQQTNDGGYIAASSTSSSGAGWEGTWFLKLSSDGDIEWQKTYGGDYIWEFGSFIQQTSDGGYTVVGTTTSFGAGESDIWFLKLSSDGDIEWQRAYGGSGWDGAYCIEQTNDGGYIVAGKTGSFGAGESDFWILKLSSDGDIEWQKNYGGAYRDSASFIQQTSDGGYVVAGDTSNTKGNILVLKLSSTGVIEWQRVYKGSGGYSASFIQQTSDGGYIVAGDLNSPEEEGCDDFNSLILKLSSDGDIEWQKTCGGNYSDDRASFIQQTIDGGYIVAGQTQSWGDRREIWVFKLSPNGDINPRCAFIKSLDAEASDADIMSEDTNITPGDINMTSEDTSMTPQDTDITAQNSDANVYNLCSEKCTLILSVTSGGTIEPAPGTHVYETGTEIRLEAKPSGEYKFETWSGNVECYGKRIIKVTMDGNKSIKASFFNPQPFKLGEGGKEEGGCFIAEAAYGSSLHPYVKIIRDVRDIYLMPSKLGRKLVDLYYKYSPFAAELITKHKTLKAAVRINLLPLVAFSYSLLHLGPIITVVLFVLIFGLPIFLISLFRRKLSRVEAKGPKALTSPD
jgi:hypothetical protein